MEKLVTYISISIIINEYEFGLPSEQFFPLTVTIPVVSSLRQVFIWIFENLLYVRTLLQTLFSEVAVNIQPKYVRYQVYK